MSKETFYFSHDYNARGDRKLVNVIMKHGMIGIGIYWCLIEMLYEEEGYLPNEYDRISFELRTDKNVIQSIINDFDLFKTDDENFWSESVLERLRKRCEKSEKTRESINKRWERYRKDTNVLRSNDKRNTSKVKESKVKENKEEKYDFISPEFLQPFLDWIEYKKARKESYKNEKSIKAFYKKLLRLSGNDSKKAILIIEDSMANNYAGLFPLKTNEPEIKKLQSITVSNGQDFK